ncbi:hypothetical protein [[Bacillus] enclensis]|jgi:hypothetical protein|uniref:SunI/YnzG family protein n=1 Tax=[Bacillus] enclensis TaxID=1402860 RepID=UPI0005098E44|nr:hypothetical protein [[Bacillus] enclensis]MBH9966311.1 hypothetical protein [[Bacillus] enclensis]
MELFELKVTENQGILQIRWQLSKIEIPLADIVNVEDDDTYGGREKSAIRIGNPYGHTDRVVIQTKTETYILFTSIGGLREKILSYQQNSEAG